MKTFHETFCPGTLQWMSYPPDRYGFVEPVRKLCADDFFGAIELGHIPDLEQRSQVRSLLAASQMRVFYGAHPRLLGGGFNPNALDESERVRAQQVLMEAVDEAAFLGAEGMAFLSGKWQAAHREEMLDQLVKTSVALCRYARDKGMNVTLEVFDYDVDKAVLIGPAPLAAEYAQRVNSQVDNFGLLVDLSHIPITHENVFEVISTLKPHIRHLHIGNAVLKPGAVAYGDRHPRFGFPHSVNGVEQVCDFFMALHEQGFMDTQRPMVLSTEVSPQTDEDADVVLAGSKRVIRDAWTLFQKRIARQLKE